MRSPTARATHGEGKSRSKPLHKRSHKNIMIQHRGSLKLRAFLDHVIKKTQIPKKVHMKKLRFAVKNAIGAMSFKKPVPKKKLMINKGIK